MKNLNAKNKNIPDVVSVFEYFEVTGVKRGISENKFTVINGNKKYNFKFIVAKENDKQVFTLKEFDEDNTEFYGKLKGRIEELMVKLADTLFFLDRILLEIIFSGYEIEYKGGKNETSSTINKYFRWFRGD